MKCKHINIEYENRWFGIKNKIRFGVCKDCNKILKEVNGIIEDGEFDDVFKRVMIVIDKYCRK